MAEKNHNDLKRKENILGENGIEVYSIVLSLGKLLRLLFYVLCSSTTSTKKSLCPRKFEQVNEGIRRLRQQQIITHQNNNREIEASSEAQSNISEQILPKVNAPLPDLLRVTGLESRRWIVSELKNISDSSFLQILVFQDDFLANSLVTGNS